MWHFHKFAVQKIAHRTMEIRLVRSLEETTNVRNGKYETPLFVVAIRILLIILRTFSWVLREFQNVFLWYFSSNVFNSFTTFMK